MLETVWKGFQCISILNKGIHLPSFHFDRKVESVLSFGDVWNQFDATEEMKSLVDPGETQTIDLVGEVHAVVAFSECSERNRAQLGMPLQTKHGRC